MNNPAILLVEDNPKDVIFTLRALNKSNLLNEIVVTRNGEEALDYLFCKGKFAKRDSNELPAVVLLDLKLPKIDGFEVLRRIRSNERTRLVPVVILTSSNDEKDLNTCYKLGANSYVTKPVSFSDFSKVISGLGCYWVLTNNNPH
ncbi:response regulator [Desulforhopalus singaporensis]|uniref:Response regulator receiver domain-containing protein n=1 Tax=Desulforhopalus singaporensis TaxID=91360 RepID=A0A1H0VCW6_9BACT|nr:response regulator [Desulforhopalus singaporensis]SDP76419.1 Response regulator receiver domain-containing protein [Desulforhopalus singaporensis]